MSSSWYEHVGQHNSDQNISSSWYMNVSNNTQMRPKYVIKLIWICQVTLKYDPNSDPNMICIYRVTSNWPSCWGQVSRQGVPWSMKPVRKKTMTQLVKQKNIRFDDSSQARVHLQSSYERNMNNLALYQPVDLENPVNCYSSNAVLGTAKEKRLLVDQNPKSMFTSEWLKCPYINASLWCREGIKG